MLKIVVLAVIQGLTEFLPVSSSGHLALAEYFLKFNPPGVALEVVLHAGTLLTILIYYRKRLLELIAKVFQGDMPSIIYGLLIGLASVPAIVLYVLAGDKVESFSDNPKLVAGLLCVTGFVMLSPMFARRDDADNIGPIHSILIGIAQAFALLPGISRSGSTIVMARHLRIPVEKAAEFSFFMAIPALSGAIVFKIPEIVNGDLGCSGLELALGAIVSCLVGLASIGFLLRLLNRGKFWFFGVYCLLIGAAALIYLHIS